MGNEVLVEARSSLNLLQFVLKEKEL